MYFTRTFDVEGMLHSTALWLVDQAKRPVGEFVDIASKIDIRQEDWTTFWSRVRV